MDSTCYQRESLSNPFGDQERTCLLASAWPSADPSTMELPPGFTPGFSLLKGGHSTFSCISHMNPRMVFAYTWMVDCYGKSRSVIYAIIIHVSPMGFLMALFVALSKQTTKPPAFLRETSRIATEKLQETSQRVLPLQKKGVAGFNPVFFAAFLPLRNCWWLRDVGWPRFLSNKL